MFVRVCVCASVCVCVCVHACVRCCEEVGVDVNVCLFHVDSMYLKCHV